MYAGRYILDEPLQAHVMTKFQNVQNVQNLQWIKDRSNVLTRVFFYM